MVLGWVVHPTVHTFKALQVSLPRLELARREDYRTASRAYLGGPIKPTSSDKINLCHEVRSPLWTMPTAVVDTEDLTLAPGERAVVLAERAMGCARADLPSGQLPQSHVALARIACNRPMR